MKTFLNTKTSEFVEVKEVAPVEKIKPKFEHAQMLEALYFIHDLFSRPNIPFFLLDETARQVKNRELLSGRALIVGIRKVDFQERNISMMEAVFPADVVGKDFICYTYIGVPIRVLVLHERGDMFTNPDTVMYQHEFFNIPNPFEEYWANRMLYHG